MRRVRLVPIPEPSDDDSDRSPYCPYTARRAGSVVQAGWLRACLLSWEWRAARSRTGACSQASGLRSTTAVDAAARRARRGRGRRARRLIMHVCLPDAEHVLRTQSVRRTQRARRVRRSRSSRSATAAPAVVGHDRDGRGHRGRGAPDDRACRLERDGWREPRGPGGAAVLRGGTSTVGPNPGSIPHYLLCLRASLTSLFLSFSLSHSLSLSYTLTYTLSLSYTHTHTLSLSLLHTHTHSLSLSLTHTLSHTHTLRV